MDLLKIKWPHLSLGYVGNFHENATLNSRFFYEIVKNPDILNRQLIFPQRVPKIGFFEELSVLEAPLFNNEFKVCVANFKHSLTDNSVSDRFLLNTLKVLLRYGCAEYVVNFNCKAKLADNVILEVDFLKICAEIQVDLSCGNQPDLNRLKTFTDHIVQYENVSCHFKIQVLNRLIVHYFRYHCAKKSFIAIEKYMEVILTELNTLDMSLPHDRLLLAYAYRGIAMSNTLSEIEKNHFISRAKEISRALHSITPLENCVYQENFYTTLQTLAKYALSLGNDDVAIGHFFEMIDLDPLDSTAYSELALLYLDQGNCEEAVKFFEKAKLLGPPGVGMNLYYEAKCYESFGDTSKYIRLLEEVVLIDPDAISPWLDLVDFYKDSQQPSKVRESATCIVNNKVLFEQLTLDEQRVVLNDANKNGY